MPVLASYKWDCLPCTPLLCLLLFDIMSMRFIHVVVRITSLFFCYCYAIFHTGIYHNLLIHFPVYEHLACFQFLASLNKVALNNLIYVFWQTFILILFSLRHSFLLSIHLGAEVLGHRMGVYSLRRYCQRVFKSDWIYTLPRNRQQF